MERSLLIMLNLRINIKKVKKYPGYKDIKKIKKLKLKKKICAMQIRNVLLWT